MKNKVFYQLDIEVKIEVDITNFINNEIKIT